MAANLAVVDYEMEDIEPPILSVEEAIKRSSFFDVPPFLYPKQVGDISKGMAVADQKITSAEVVVIYIYSLFRTCSIQYYAAEYFPALSNLNSGCAFSSHYLKN